MTTWIFGIDEENPEHWDYAKRDGFWHLRRRIDLRAGDSIYFWQGGSPKRPGCKKGLLGLVRATQDITPMRPNESMPWNVTDEKRAKYKFRVEFDVIAPDSSSIVSWTTLQEHTGVKSATNFGPQRVKQSDGARWLRRQLDIGETDDISAPLQGAVDALREGTAGSKEDLRRRIRASIVVREGQGPFRKGLLDAYKERCAITGVSEPVLDAAHIRPYMGEHSNAASNGILLRTDLHTLFDKHLLTVVYDGSGYHVRVSDLLDAPMYRGLDRQVLTVVPSSQSARPNPELLAEHNAACDWL